MEMISRVVGNAFPAVNIVATELRKLRGDGAGGVPALPPPVATPRGRNAKATTIHVAILTYQNTHSPTGNLVRALVKRLVSHHGVVDPLKPTASAGGGSGAASIHYRVSGEGVLTWAGRLARPTLGHACDHAGGEAWGGSELRSVQQSWW